MYGYLKTRPYTRTTDLKDTKQGKKTEVCNEDILSPTNGNASDCAKNPQTTSYLSWESVSYFFGLSTTANGAPEGPRSGKILAETQDSHINKPPKKQPQHTRNMEKTLKYTVTSYDTLPKIALKFDVTPSELTRLNRLAIRTLYPGQVLQVPCPKPPDNCTECSKSVITTKPTAMTHVHKVPVAKRVSFEDIDEDVVETFIKIKSKYITDGQGVVKGFLLITPHAIIFNPDVSEILVVDRGAEYYQVQFPMDSACGAGMFDDIASMVIHDPLKPGHFFLDKPLMLLLDETNTSGSPKDDSSDDSNTLHESTESTSRDDTGESLTETQENFPPNPASIPKTDTSSDAEIVADVLNDVLEQVDKRIARAEGEDTTSLETNPDDDVVTSSSHLAETNVANHHELLSHATCSDAHSTPKLAPYKGPGVGERLVKGMDEDSEEHSYSEGISTDSGIDEHLSRENVDRDSSFTDKHPSDSKTWLEDSKMRHVFSAEVTPRLSTSHVDMPKYLCVKIKRACWRALRPRLCRHAHESIQRASDERREFWFSIPCERLLEVYSFFLQWCPAIHEGESEDGASGDELDLVRAGFTDYSVITMSEDDAGLIVVDNFYSTSPEKEKVRVGKKRPGREKKKKKKKAEKKEVLKRPTRSWSVCTIEEPLPEMIGKSEILTETNILELSQFLPSRTIGHTWCLIYSTYHHGISLKTLYRALNDYDTPTLLVIMDDSRKVFGAFASSPFAVSEHFYGTGECFLFSFHPHLRIFPWSGENNFFIKGDTDSLAFGGGEGNFGLWLDEDLYHGSSHSCKTFNNEPLTVAEDFLCSGVEIWCFE